MSKIVWVHWKDACFQNDGNVSIDDVDGPAPLLSCGVFVKETDEYIAIALDKDLEESNFRHVMTIPKVNIIRYEILELVGIQNADAT